MPDESNPPQPPQIPGLDAPIQQLDKSKLTAKETERALKFVNGYAEKKGDAVCPICGTQNWILNPSFVELNQFYPLQGTMLGGPVYPMILLFCKECGFTHFLNAKYSGILDEEERKRDVN